MAGISRHRIIWTSLVVAAATLVFTLAGVGTIRARPVAGAPVHQRSSHRSPGQSGQIFPQQAWNLVNSPNPSTYGSALSGVAAISANDVWAVGYFYPGSSGPYNALAEHFDGTTWSAVPVPDNGTSDNQLNAVSADATNDVWAVGNHIYVPLFQTQTLIEHWDGSQWSIVPSPSITTSETTDLLGVAAVSPTDVWAVGFYVVNENADAQVIEHWDGTAWSMVTGVTPPAATSTDLNGVVALGPNDVWAVGGQVVGGNGETLIEHWDGTSWNVAPDATSGTFGDIAGAGPSDLWAVGNYGNPQTHLSQTLTEHWNGTNWTVVPSPSVANMSNYLVGVTARDSTDVWAVGSFTANTVTNLGSVLVLYWNGNTWQVQAAPSPDTYNDILKAVSWSSSGPVWAAGVNVSDTLIEAHPTFTASPPPWRARWPATM